MHDSGEARLGVETMVEGSLRSRARCTTASMLVAPYPTVRNSWVAASRIRSRIFSDSVRDGPPRPELARPRRVVVPLPVRRAPLRVRGAIPDVIKRVKGHSADSPAADRTGAEEARNGSEVARTVVSAERRVMPGGTCGARSRVPQRVVVMRERVVIACSGGAL
jgi:hypothetical protein